MPGERQVKEIMASVRNYSTVLADAPLKEAVEALQDSLHQQEGIWYGFHSVVVLDNRQKLVGLLTLRSVLKAVEFLAISSRQQLKGSSWGWYFTNRVQKETGLRVKDVMRPLGLVTVKVDDTVWDAALKMLTYRVNSIPVLDGGRVAGIVRTIDVFQVIGELLADE